MACRQKTGGNALILPLMCVLGHSRAVPAGGRSSHLPLACVKPVLDPASLQIRPLG